MQRPEGNPRQVVGNGFSGATLGREKMLAGDINNFQGDFQRTLHALIDHAEFSRAMKSRRMMRVRPGTRVPDRTRRQALPCLA